MKELSIEEKAKRYDEAIEIAKEINNEQKAQPFNVMTRVFPELKESEDERIRKAIINVFASHEDYEVFFGASVEDIIAWLEKQGEQKPTETVKWSPQEESCICQLESLVKEQWRQAERVHNSENIKKMLELMFFLKTLNPNKKPQRIISAEVKEAMYDKPAWSEEDETIINNLVWAISNDCVIPQDREDYYDWLKSLKDRVQPQPKQEWSEEDEKKLRGICNYISLSNSPEGFEEWIDWLKSLKERYTWKPSEGQLECLGYAIEKAEKDWSPLTNNRIYLTLKALKEQLEKL